MKIWTNEMLRKAVELLQDGLSTSETAEKLNRMYGTHVTWDGVRTKVNREGYSITGQPMSNKAIDETADDNGYEENGDLAREMRLNASVSHNMALSRAHSNAEKEDLKDKSRTIKQTADGSSEAEIECLFNTKRQFTPDELLEIAGLSPKDFTLKQTKGSKWSVVTTDQGRKWNFYASVLATPKTGSIDAMIEAINNSVEPKRYPKENIGVNNLVIPLADMHFGWTHYADVADKVSQYQNIMHKGYDTIVIAQLGDLFHSDQMHSTQTVKGTLLDQVDMRQAFKDAFAFMNDICTTAIASAKQVRYYTVFGNHSGDLEYAFALALKERFPQIDFELNDDTPQTDWRCAFKLGHVGIMCAHGDTAKTRLTGLFPVEYKHIWADTETHELFTGHFHSERFKDENGVMWRQLGTVKNNDPYEIVNGFTTARHLMYAFEYDDERLRCTYEL